MNTLKIDFYTKAVLTVIAGCLVVIALQNGLPSPVSEAQAQAQQSVQQQYSYANRPANAVNVSTVNGVALTPVTTKDGTIAIPVKIVEMPPVTIQKP
jgi:hypothetical protein